MSKWQWLWQQFRKKLWVRTSLFCVIAVATALAAVLLKDYIPEDISRKVGAESVDRILQVLATSMLAVTTFSLSTMVAAYTAATSNVTPRATQLLLADNTAQNALSVFLGSFLYSIVGIVALTMGVYGESGRLVLFAVTIAVILLIVGVLIRWTNYLTQLGRVGQTTDMVERETRMAMENRMANPYLGGTPLVSYRPHATHLAIRSDVVGYVQHIDMGMLAELAEAQGVTLYLQQLPGTFNNGSHPLIYASKPLDEECQQQAVRAFSIGGDRSFEQDPRFGLIVLSEIASRALSPAMNDPGTAIDVIGTAVRLLLPWLAPREAEPDITYPAIHVPPLYTNDLLDDIFTPIARDGAAMIEVGVRLQKAFHALQPKADADTKKHLRQHSHLAAKRAEAAFCVPEDTAALKAHLLP